MTRAEFYYKNHRGETELREIEPVSLDYVPTPHIEYGYGPGWFLHGLDYTVRDGKARNGEARSFALSNIVMTDFKPGTNLGVPAFKVFLDPPSKAMWAKSMDEPTGGEGNGLAITGRLRNAVKGPYHPGAPDRLSGESYGHTKFPDGMPITTSNVTEELGNNLFKTRSGSIYLVESWLPGHAPKSAVDEILKK